MALGSLGFLLVPIVSYIGLISLFVVLDIYRELNGAVGIFPAAFVDITTADTTTDNEK